MTFSARPADLSDLAHDIAASVLSEVDDDVRLPLVSPGSPEWDRRSDVVARAMQLIADGLVDRAGVSGLAATLGYSERQLNRLVSAELGVGPIALARGRRAAAARTLIETTSLPFTEIAFAAGFGSVRQFNDTVRAVYASTPRELRTRTAERSLASSPAPATGELRLTLAARAPFDPAAMFEFFAARAVPGVEHVTGEQYVRTLRLPRGHGVAAVSAALRGTGLDVKLVLEDLRDLTPAVTRVRRLFDLDADPVTIDEHLSRDPLLEPLVAASLGRRVPGSVDVFETAVRAVIGQQISISGARTVTARLTDAAGEPLRLRAANVRTVFPSPAAIVAAPPDAFAMPRRRAASIVALAQAVIDGAVDLAAGRDELRAQLLALPGFGPWTADYVCMRGRGDPDAYLPTDLGVVRGVNALGSAAVDTDRWRPWRAYALHHLWAVPHVSRTALC